MDPLPVDPYEDLENEIASLVRDETPVDELFGELAENQQPPPTEVDREIAKRPWDFV